MKVNRRSFLATGAAGVAAVARSEAQASSASAVSADDDPLGIRSEFPVAAQMTYLNSPYITPPPRSVEQAGIEFVRAKTNDPISLGAMLGKGDEVRNRFASLFGANPAEVSFLFATSEGENIVAGAADLTRHDNVVVDDLHYETSYLLYQKLKERTGVEVRVAKSEGGRADPEHFERHVDAGTRIVSVSWVSHQNGFRHDLKALAELAHAHDALLYADGIQALGMFETNLHDEGVDFVTAGTYKWLLAAYGVAPFYVREEHLERIPPDRFGSLSIRSNISEHEFEVYDTARKYEYATMAFGPLYQLGAGLAFLEQVGLARIEKHTVGLAAYLHKGLTELGVDVLTPVNNGSSIVAFRHGAAPEAVKSAFERENIRVSFREEDKQIRAGAALFNNQADIDHLLETMKGLASA